MHNGKYMRAGQVLIVVLLILAVALTTGLSIVSRSVNEVAQSTTSDESAKALAAAEAGVEAAIGQKLGQNAVGDVGESTYTVVSSNVLDEKKDSVVFPDLFAGQVATLVLYDSFGPPPQASTMTLGKQMDLCWGTAGFGKSPALEVTVYYYRGSAYKSITAGYKDGGGSGFSDVDHSSMKCPSSGNYRYHKKVSLLSLGLLSGDVPIYLRMKLLYNTSSAQHLGVWAVSAGNVFPAQGTRVKVLGQSGSTSRMVEVVQSLGTPLGIFDQAVYSGGSLGN